MDVNPMQNHPSETVDLQIFRRLEIDHHILGALGGIFIQDLTNQGQRNNRSERGWHPSGQGSFFHPKRASSLKRKA